MPYFRTQYQWLVIMDHTMPVGHETVLVTQPTLVYVERCLIHTILSCKQKDMDSNKLFYNIISIKVIQDMFGAVKFWIFSWSYHFGYFPDLTIFISSWRVYWKSILLCTLKIWTAVVRMAIFFSLYACPVGRHIAFVDCLNYQYPSQADKNFSCRNK